MLLNLGHAAQIYPAIWQGLETDKTIGFSFTVNAAFNAYFGVTKEPIYTVLIEIKTILPADWSKIIAKISTKASAISKLLLGEVPDNIEAIFAEMNAHLLPYNRQGFQTKCSCPDYSNPCKHRNL